MDSDRALGQTKCTDKQHSRCGATRPVLFLMRRAGSRLYGYFCRAQRHSTATSSSVPSLLTANSEASAGQPRWRLLGALAAGGIAAELVWSSTYCEPERRASAGQTEVWCLHYRQSKLRAIAPCTRALHRGFLNRRSPPPLQPHTTGRRSPSMTGPRLEYG